MSGAFLTMAGIKEGGFKTTGYPPNRPEHTHAHTHARAHAHTRTHTHTAGLTLWLVYWALKTLSSSDSFLLIEKIIQAATVSVFFPQYKLQPPKQQWMHMLFFEGIGFCLIRPRSSSTDVHCRRGVSWFQSWVTVVDWKGCAGDRKRDIIECRCSSLQAYRFLADNKKLGLSGRPERPVGCLGTSKVSVFFWGGGWGFV